MNFELLDADANRLNRELNYSHVTGIGLCINWDNGFVTLSALHTADRSTEGILCGRGNVMSIFYMHPRTDYSKFIEYYDEKMKDIIKAVAKDFDIYQAEDGEWYGEFRFHPEAEINDSTCQGFSKLIVSKLYNAPRVD